jgi:hypothetical protein
MRTDAGRRRRRKRREKDLMKRKGDRVRTEEQEKRK